jgi:hypothetical protein
MTTTEVLSKGDQLVERGARFLEDLARDFSADGGAKRKLAGELVEDAAFLRKLKPTLIAARARGERPAVQEPPPQPAPPPTPATLPPRPRPARSGGVSPFAVVGAAFVAGIVLAKFLDWRGHAHPRG